MSNAISVTSLVRYLKDKLDNDFNLSSVLVKGEISNFVAHRSNHYYFTLKDQDAKINCIMFASNASKVNFKVMDGMSVIVSGNISVYEANGSFQIYVREMEKAGLGAIYAAIEERKNRLFKAGYFEESHRIKKPMYPMRIGVITAKEGAAIQDVMATLKKRWPIAEVILYPSLVQGKDAPQNMIEQLHKSDNDGLDIILLVRGGGSIEDLWAFYDEELCKTIYNMHTCIITGVGHETDTTLVDYVSDYRSLTPTAAAQNATPEMLEVLNELNMKRVSLIRSMQNNLERNKVKLNNIKNHPYFKDPHLKIQSKAHELLLLSERLDNFKNKYQNKKNAFIILKSQFIQSSGIINKQREKLSLLDNKLNTCIKSVSNEKHQNLKYKVALLDAYSPLKIISKGYTLTYQNDILIKKKADLDPNLKLDILYQDGKVEAKITKKEQV